MAEPKTVARPYAEAAFKLADEGDKLTVWSAMLGALAQVSQDERMRVVMGDPNLPAAKVAGMYVAVLAGRLTAEGENFLRVLAENRRLFLLPEIRAQFEQLKNEREGTVDAEIQTAFELTPAQLADLVARLEKHTGRKVKASVHPNKDLIGGVRVVIGDKVIDASARAQLAALEGALKA